MINNNSGDDNAAMADQRAPWRQSIENQWKWRLEQMAARWRRIGARDRPASPTSTIPPHPPG